MSLYSMGDGNGCSLPCGFNSCMETDGLFDGVSREEKQALRRAEQAERNFRISHGYRPESLWQRLQQLLRS